MPTFDIMEGRIKYLLMAAVQKEERTRRHLAKEQKTLTKEKTNPSRPLANGSSYVRVATGALQSTVEKTEASQTLQ